MSCGLELSSVPELSEQILQQLTDSGYDFIVVPIVHPRYKRELISGKACNRQEPLTRSDLTLTSRQWNSLIMGKLSSYLELDSQIPHVRKASEAIFLQELDFANHLSLNAIVLRLQPGNNINMAKLLASKMTTGTCRVMVHIPMNAKKVDSWEIWNQLRFYCHFNRKLGVALELSNEIPSDLALARWLGEPVKCLILNTNIFLTNQKEYKVLSIELQEVIRKFLKLDIQIIIKGKNQQFEMGDYCKYIKFLVTKKLVFETDFMREIKRTQDVLQEPIQPLADNLDTIVYEVFEKDPHKYNMYQLAIKKAVEDKSKSEPNGKLVVMVVGAGRGPLVRAVLNAGALTGRQLKVYALEKNPYAVNTLQALVRELWPGKVSVISGDMRSFNPEEKADIIVSELLGSFGDNELSPECLEGAQRFLKDDGISIPMSYTSWLAPIQSLILFNKIRHTRPVDTTLLSCYETPYVVNLSNKYDIDKTQSLFTFVHPNREEVIDNTRFKTLKFTCSQNCVLTGFAGYFSSCLYKDIMISTEPTTHTKNMISWFPLYFPISEPIHIKKEDIVEVAFWRSESKTKVWYEWCMKQPISGAIHNLNGRSYNISK